MAVGDMINKLRVSANMSQEQFAELFGVSRQSVQKWESNLSVPELEKLIKISKYFDISLDALVLKSDARVTEELNYNKTLKPKYANIHAWESYSSNLLTEYQQSIEEGLDLTVYADVFAAVSRLPKNETKKKLGDVLFDVVFNANMTENYKYIEPSTLEEIRNLRKNVKPVTFAGTEQLEKKIHGAWIGRICGCLLDKTVEGIRTDELIPFLKETDNYPMHRYILHSDLNDDILGKYRFRFANRCYADKVDGMPVDDDTNYVVLAQQIIEKYGRNFTPYDIFDTIRAGRNSKHRCNKHFTIYPVLDVGNGGIPKCHFGGKLRIPGVDITEIVSTDLCADPFTVRIFIFSGFRRLESFDKIAKSNSFGGAIFIFAL